MYGVLRSYSGDGAKKLAGRLEVRKAEVTAVPHLPSTAATTIALVARDA